MKVKFVAAMIAAIVCSTAIPASISRWIARFSRLASSPRNQPIFGNMTRYNPKFRAFPNYNENFSLAKAFSIRERLRADFRAEMFDAFNRAPCGQGWLTIQSQTFGILSPTAGNRIHSPRQVQLALKLYF